MIVYQLYPVEIWKYYRFLSNQSNVFFKYLFILYPVLLNLHSSPAQRPRSPVIQQRARKMPAFQFFFSCVFPPFSFAGGGRSIPSSAESAYTSIASGHAGLYHPGVRPGDGRPRTQAGTARGTQRVFRSLEHIKPVAIRRFFPNDTKTFL